jgi:hypothetical protein
MIKNVNEIESISSNTGNPRSQSPIPINPKDKIYDINSRKNNKYSSPIMPIIITIKSRSYQLNNS